MRKSTQISDKRPRCRPRAYDAEVALASARDAFWRAGYSATSLDDLSAATGMNRPSIYGAFGDKHALYLETLARYRAMSVAALHQALDADLPIGELLARVFAAAIAIYTGAGGRGCYAVGTAATESLSDDAV